MTRKPPPFCPIKWLGYLCVEDLAVKHCSRYPECGYDKLAREMEEVEIGFNMDSTVRKEETTEV